MLFNEDSITGNGSSSYTFNTYKAECNLVGNWSLLKEALAITEVFLFTQTITTKNTVGVFV